MRARADAARNSVAVLDAAREVFAEKGLAAGVDEVAARAGVGKATVYRCWPTKDALVAAVTGQDVVLLTVRSWPRDDVEIAMERIVRSFEIVPSVT